MKFLRMLFFVFSLLVLVLGAFHDRLLGMAAEPFLEQVMTKLFDMPVLIDGVRISPLFSKVRLKELRILNPPGFLGRDHFTVREVTFHLDLRVLKNKFIRIRKAHFKEAVFAIESYMTPEGSRTNVWHWYHHMGLDAEDVPLPPREAPHPENVGEDSWRVRIDRLELEKGTIIFDDRRESPEQRWIFEHIQGFWTGFDFLSDYNSPTFTETIQVDATFGSNPPARFKGGGKCQFADGDNFDVETRITGGSIEEYHFLLAGIPGEVRGGTFDLKSHLLCVEGDLKSEHVLTLKSMKFASPTATQKILKYPFGTVRFLLENQKTVELEIKVDGDIDDPKFRMARAFTKAFQKSLMLKAKAGVTGTVKLATGAPEQVKNGLSKLGEILTEPFVHKGKEGTEAGTENEPAGAQTHG